LIGDREPLLVRCRAVPVPFEHVGALVGEGLENLGRAIAAEVGRTPKRMRTVRAAVDDVEANLLWGAGTLDSDPTERDLLSEGEVQGHRRHVEPLQDEVAQRSKARWYCAYFGM
jgi:hypothetical protein